MTIYGFQIFCDISSGGWGYALIGHMGGVYPYMGPSTPPRVFWGTKMCLTLLLFHYGSKVPAVTITVFITILEQNR